MKAAKDSVAVTFELPAAEGQAAGEKKEASFDRVLISIGRRPNPVQGIENTGVVVNQRGFVEVESVAADRRAVDLRDRRRCR